MNTHKSNSIRPYTEIDFNELINHLYQLVDEDYKLFHSKLIPGVSTTFLGVRVPILRVSVKSSTHFAPQLKGL